MRISRTTACLPLLAFLTACSNTAQGHYDANGNYVPPPNPTPAQRMHAPDAGAADDEHNKDEYSQYDTDDKYPDNRQRYETTVTTTYDDNGNRVTQDYVTQNTFSIPAALLPPRGLCRVWFTDRKPENQPGVESCEGIRQRAPAGSYVIYSY